MCVSTDQLVAFISASDKIVLAACRGVNVWPSYVLIISPHPRRVLHSATTGSAPPMARYPAMRVARLVSDRLDLAAPTVRIRDDPLTRVDAHNPPRPDGPSVNSSHNMQHVSSDALVRITVSLPPSLLD